MEIFSKIIHNKIWGCETWYNLVDLNFFGLLLKVITTTDDLSVQVHPNDELAKLKGLKRGKTEMWFVLEADKGAKVLDGFSSDLTKEDLMVSLNEGTIEKVLHSENVESGDVLYIPAGRVHSIGKGIKLVEIQQISDVTYRLYDYNRVDDCGNKRDLHINDALFAVDYSGITEAKTQYEERNGIAELVKTDFFTVNLLSHSLEKQIDIPTAYMCIKEGVIVNGHKLQTLDCVLLKKGEQLCMRLDRGKVLEIKG